MPTAVAAMEVKLKVVGGKNAGVEIAVVAPQFLIGRAEECQLRPKSDYVSRRHAMIVVDDGKATIADLGSRTGTFLNGKSLTKETPAEIKQDDMLKIGPLEFSVVIKHGLNRQKHPKVNSPEEAAARIAQKAKTYDDDVDKWLQPTEEETRLGATIEEPSVGTTILSAADLIGQTLSDIPPPSDEPSETADGSKLPPPPKPASAERPDQAASDMLKNYLRRR